MIIYRGIGKSKERHVGASFMMPIEVGIDTLEQRLRKEAVERRGAATAIGLMNAWTRKAE
jgi:hypothetical protein